MKSRILFLFIIVSLISWSVAAIEVKLKDLGNFAGVRSNQLFGYGVVVGLDGTGDTTQNKFTFQTIANYMERMGITIQPKEFQMRNTAAVALTAVLPPFARIGEKIDITVSSIGSAKSLQGGVLLISPLYGPDGQVYAVAQGPVSIGGFNVGSGGGTVSKNHPTAGLVVGGGLIEREVNFEFADQRYLTLVLNQDDFTTCNRVSEVINRNFGEIARPRDSRSVLIIIPDKFLADKVAFASYLENLKVTPDTKARVVVNERTGTVVFGDNVSISRVALSHGSIIVTIKPETIISQPPPLSGGETKVVQQSQIDVKEQEAKVTLIDESVTVADLVNALNKIGATPRDIIAILQAIKRAGALQAELEVI